jgi:hypothetical protein
MSSLVSPNTYITQGTIVDNVPWSLDPAPLGIVLSNPCDLEWGKASFILIASLVPAQDTLQLSKEFKGKVSSANARFELTRSTWESLNSMIENYVHNKNVTRYFFINPKDVIDAPLLFVDFQNLITIPIENKENLAIIAQLPSPYIEKMIVHFSSYISRIGVDRISDERTKSFIQEIALPYYSGSV